MFIALLMIKFDFFSQLNYSCLHNVQQSDFIYEYKDFSLSSNSENLEISFYSLCLFNSHYQLFSCEFLYYNECSYSVYDECPEFFQSCYKCFDQRRKLQMSCEDQISRYDTERRLIVASTVFFALCIVLCILVVILYCQLAPFCFKQISNQ